MANANEATSRALKDRMDWSWEALAIHLERCGEPTLAGWARGQDPDKSQRARATDGNADTAKPPETRR